MERPDPRLRGYRLDLRGTNLQGADLSALILSGADLHSRMEGATWTARMTGDHRRRRGVHLFRKGAGADLTGRDGRSGYGARMEGA